MLLNYPNLPNRDISYAPVGETEFVSVETPVKVDDDVQFVTSYVKLPVKHPISDEVKRDMFADPRMYDPSKDLISSRFIGKDLSQVFIEYEDVKGKLSLSLAEYDAMKLQERKDFEDFKQNNKDNSSSTSSTSSTTQV